MLMPVRLATFVSMSIHLVDISCISMGEPFVMRIRCDRFSRSLSRRRSRCTGAVCIHFNRLHNTCYFNRFLAKRQFINESQTIRSDSKLLQTNVWTAIFVSGFVFNIQNVHWPFAYRRKWWFFWQAEYEETEKEDRNGCATGFPHTEVHLVLNDVLSILCPTMMARLKWVISVFLKLISLFCCRLGQLKREKQWKLPIVQLHV